MPVPFHLAIPVHDLEAARAFYVGTLGCGEGRSGPDWLDLDFFGHQVVVHVMAGGHRCLVEVGTNAIDGHPVPLPHFGVILDMAAWRALAGRLRAEGVPFLLEPHVRYASRVNEQASLMLRDPSGNAVEIKAFADIDRLFATGPGPA